MPLHSITKFIPLTPQTDPNNFPQGEYRPYPRMMVHVDDHPDAKLRGKPFFDASGRHPVIVQDEDEEAAFRAAHPGEVRDNVESGASMQDELAKLRAENAKLRESQSGAKDPAPKSGAGIASLVKPQAEGDAHNDEDATIQPRVSVGPRRTAPKKLD